MKKFLPIFLFLCLLAAISGYGRIAESAAPEIQNPLEVGAAEDVYILLDGILMGGWRNGQWQSIDNITGAGGLFPFADVLAAESYTLYDQQGEVATANRVQLGTHYGPGDFDNQPDALALASCGELYEDEEDAWFTLPALINAECQKLAVPDNGFIFNFDCGEYTLALSTPLNVLPTELDWDVAATDGDDAELQRNLQRQNIEAETNYTEAVAGDFDGNGSTETLLIANSPVDEGGWPTATQEQISGNGGTYALALLREEDGSYTTLYSEAHRFDGESEATTQCYHLEIAGVFDLNGDGRCELCLRYRGWEWGRIQVLAKNGNGHWGTMLRAHCGI